MTTNVHALQVAAHLAAVLNRDDRTHSYTIQNGQIYLVADDAGDAEAIAEALDGTIDTNSVHEGSRHHTVKALFLGVQVRATAIVPEPLRAVTDPTHREVAGGGGADYYWSECECGTLHEAPSPALLRECTDLHYGPVPA